jgi:hypothetical protein
VIYFIQKYNIGFLDIYLGERFLPVIPMALMAWAVFTMFPINVWATYLRCHKQEPLMWNSIVVGVLCAISTMVFGKINGIMGITISFALLRFISLTWIYTIYKKKKYEWHR